jgi:signal transduction histidine kinase
MPRLRLQHRLVVPLLVIVLAATTTAALIALSVSSRALQGRVRSQLAGAADVVSRGDLALNPVILENLRGIIGADVVTFGPDGRVIASTAGPAREHVVEAARRVVTSSAASSQSTSVVSAQCGVPCLVAFRTVEGRPDVFVALVAETSELTAVTGAVTRAIVLGAGLTAVVMMVVGHLVVRRVTAPLQRLVQFARELTPEDVRRRAPVGNDDIGELAEAFNGMLDRLQRSQAALLRSEKLAVAGLLAARVAHDVRNPLSSIKMQTQLLEARLRRDPEDRATLTSILHDINQVESVIRDLVEAARPGDLQRQPTSLNLVIGDALQQLAPQFTHRKIRVTTQLDDSLPLVSLDFARFRQALLNVLVNAAEAITAAGEISVVSRREQSSVVVEICDDGTGIDPGVADRVFDPFVSTKREGVGLGLVNAKAVVEGHGGQIRLAARLPKGTCASIVLPT